MAIRSISEYLVSGEAHDINISGNIGYLSLSDAEYNGMFLRIENGLTSLYRADNSDVTWTDTDNTVVLLNSSPNQVLDVVIIDHDVPAEELATFLVSGKVSNSKNSAEELYIQVRDDGVPMGSGGIVQLLKNEMNKTFVFSGNIGEDIAQDSVVSVEFSASSANALTLNGDELMTTIEITLPQAVPV